MAKNLQLSLSNSAFTSKSSGNRRARLSNQVLLRGLVAFAFLSLSLGCSVATAQTEVTGTWTGSLDPVNIVSVHRTKRVRTVTDETISSGEKVDKDKQKVKVIDGGSTVSTDTDNNEGYRSFEPGTDPRGDDKPKGDRIYLDFKRNTANGEHNQTGHTFLFTELQGLTRDQVTAGGAVSFSLVREAGTIACEGAFQNGTGTGTFRFTPNASFVSAMRSRGFDFEAQNSSWGHGSDLEDRLFTAAAINVTTALADDLATAGLGKLDLGDLFKAAIFHVDSKFASEMKASGFPNLGMDELVKARIFKIDANFVTQVVQMGFANESFESLVKMRIFKVTPEFIAMARNEGLGNLSVEQLVKMRIFKIDSDFIRKAKADGVPLNVERLVERRIGVGRGREQ